MITVEMWNIISRWQAILMLQAISIEKGSAKTQVGERLRFIGVN